MKQRLYSHVLLVLILLAMTPPVVRAETNTAMAGVDGDRLFAGVWFTASPRLDLMLSLYDKADLGWGLDYQAREYSLKLTSQWREYEAMLVSARGALHYYRDDTAGTAAGALNWNCRDLAVTGNYSTTEDGYTSGALNARWNGTAWRSQLHSAYRDDDGQLKNYRWKNEWRTKSGTWSVDLQDNMFSEGSNWLIGEGAEFSWGSPGERWRIAYGRFHETESDLAEDRLQLQWQDRREKRFDRNSLGLDITAAGYLYGGDESQQIGGLSGWWRHDFSHGSLKWKLENIWRAGNTPFAFDYEDDYSCLTWVEFDWRQACHSSFSVKYDVLDSGWRNVRGLLEAPLGTWTGSLTANYDFGAAYDDSDLVYLFLLSSPAGSFSVGQSLNYRLDKLDTDLEWKIVFTSGDRLRVKLSYDWEDRKLADLLLEYRAMTVGTFTLTYDLDKPKIVLIYTWDV